MLARLDPGRAPSADQLSNCLSRAVSPIWMDSSTSRECGRLPAGGGPARVCSRTNRFASVRAIHGTSDPEVLQAGSRGVRRHRSHSRRQLVPRVAARRTPRANRSRRRLGHEPDGPRVGVHGGRPRSRRRLPDWPRSSRSLVPSWTIVGTLSPYWQARHRLPPSRVVVWSGDNPCSLIGTGLVREGVAAISLGTSDTIFSLMREPRTDTGGTGNVFGAPTGDFMGLTCFANGSIARERDPRSIRPHMVRLLGDAPTRRRPATMVGFCCRGSIRKSRRPCPTPGVRRYNLAIDDVNGHVRGVVEAQMLSMALHSKWMQIDVDRFTRPAAARPIARSCA